MEELRYICSHAYKIREPDIFEKIPVSNSRLPAIIFLSRWIGSAHSLSQSSFKSFRFWLTGFGKPDPRFFRALCEALDEKPENVLFVDDTLRHILAAKDCGLQTLHFDSKKVLSEEINRYLADHD